MSGPAAVEPFAPGVLLADSSAWARSSHPEIAPRWRAAVGAERIATSPVVVIELLYSTRDAAEFDDTEGLLRSMREVAVDRTVTAAAIAAMRRLAETGRHRVPVTDLLVAAAAQDAGFGVLHYDRHYDILAEVLRFESVWVAPAGSLD